MSAYISKKITSPLNSEYTMAGGGSGGSSTTMHSKPSTWTTIKPAAELDYDIIFEQIAKSFNKVPTVEHKCHNCGGTLEIKTTDGIFKCPYCKSVYAIGTKQINWRY